MKHDPIASEKWFIQFVKDLIIDGDTGWVADWVMDEREWELGEEP